MIRFLHTADWQLGLKLAWVPGDAGARARAQRLETVRRIAEVAKARKVDAVVVAGDVFDDNAVGRDTIQAARDALAAFAPIPVLLLPGNHDAAVPGGVLERLSAGGHVRVLLDDTPLTIGAARFYPCPLRRRHEREDPTRHLPEGQPGDPIRVAVAHGGLLDFGEDGGAEDIIDARRVLARGFDYLALGDWHGTLSFDRRVWYSGAPEPTRHKEKEPGNVLLVEVDAPGAEPRVERVPVARTRWITRRETLARDEDVTALSEWLLHLPERSWTLVELVLEGELPLTSRSTLEALLEQAGEEFLHLRVDASALHDHIDAKSAAALAPDGALQLAVQRLLDQGDDPAAGALRLLHRILREEERP